MNKTEEVEMLRYRVAELESALGQTADFYKNFQLTPMQSKFLGLLMAKELVSRESFFAALYSDTADTPCEHIPNVMLTSIRGKLKPFGVAVHNSYGHGWYLSDDDKKLIKELCT